MRSFRWTAFACALAVVALVVAACGSTNDEGGGSSGTKADVSGGTIKPGKKGGVLTYLAAGDVDYLDPGQEYYTFGAVVTYATNRKLYSFKPNDSLHAVPDLATVAPEISPDNKTITVHIRKGAKYAPR